MSGLYESRGGFKDYFSDRASAYARYRPSYPPALLDFVANLATRHQLAWDCGTGNGQAAVALAGRFDRVVATDASAAQLAHALRHERVEYRVALADASGLPDGSADLITVAQALHWFDLARFYAEVRRVLAPGGALAVWSYGDPVLDDSALDEILQQFNLVTMASYWPSDRRRAGERYREMPFPFVEASTPTVTLECQWTLPELAGYLRSWSATARYIAQHGADPVTDVEGRLAARWGGSTVRRLVRWPLAIRAGR